MRRGVIQGLVLLRAHQIFNEKTLKLINTEQRQHQWREIKQQRGRKEGGFNSSSQGKHNNTEMFSASLRMKMNVTLFSVHVTAYLIG